MVIGWITTGLYWALFLAFAALLNSSWAALISLTVSTLVNTAAQRRFTFATEDSATAKRDHLMSLAVFGLAWLLTVAVLNLANTWFPSIDVYSELALAQACTLLGSAARFSLLQIWTKN